MTILKQKDYNMNTFHTHPRLEAYHQLDSQHVIVDREEYEKVCKLLLIKEKSNEQTKHGEQED